MNAIIPKMEGVTLKTFGELCSMRFSESDVAVRLGGDFIGGIFRAYSNLTLAYLKWDVRLSSKPKEKSDAVGERKRVWMDVETMANQN